MRLKAGREQTSWKGSRAVWNPKVIHVSICFPLSYCSFLSGIQLVCECQEATEEHGEAARPELGAEDQTLQQICPGQCREAERQQRGQLLRRYASTASKITLHFI